MARYIDLDKLLKGLEDELKDKNPNDIAYLIFKLFIGRLNHEPTADVVPMSEVGELKAIIADHKASEERLEELYSNAKADVASEIFAEIEKHILENCCVTDDDVDGIWKHIAELKKKYVEGEG